MNGIEKTIQRCDNNSVGVIVRNPETEQYLAIARARYPFGVAMPAGHVDDHGSLWITGVNEVKEETGITLNAESMRVILEGFRSDRSCRRPGGDHHNWTVFAADAYTLKPRFSLEETVGGGWYDKSDLHLMAETGRLLLGSGGPIEPSAAVMESVWVDLLDEIKFFD